MQGRKHSQEPMDLNDKGLAQKPALLCSSWQDL